MKLKDDSSSKTGIDVIVLFNIAINLYFGENLSNDPQILLQ